MTRRLSRPMARAVRDVGFVTPNMVSWISLGLAVLAAMLYAFGGSILPRHYLILGVLDLTPHVALAGIMVQLSSIVDGVDGDLARMRHAATKSGGVLDAILDRYADIAILTGLFMAVWQEGGMVSVLPFALLTIPIDSVVLFCVYILALSGSLMVSYSRARLEHANLFVSDSVRFLGASRDVRLFVVFICSLVTCPLLALVVIAVSGNMTVLFRLKEMMRVDSERR
ncbi:MAG: CDP-alcohol phosphatidyltransferase family protein [Candidatus Thorarchaeota archaeon]